jgi:hypothetical protein
MIEKPFTRNYMVKKILMKYLFFITLIIFVQFSFAQEERPYIKKAFVIVQSTKDYATAKLTAEKAASQLHQKLDLRELQPNKKTGLTFSDSVCENEGGYPCYISRGRYDNGNYVSIEWSNAFEKFAEGYYIVVISSGLDAAGTNEVLKNAKKYFKDAYAKKAEIYVGCMH